MSIFPAETEISRRMAENRRILLQFTLTKYLAIYDAKLQNGKILLL